MSKKIIQILIFSIVPNLSFAGELFDEFTISTKEKAKDSVLGKAWTWVRRKAQKIPVIGSFFDIQEEILEKIDQVKTKTNVVTGKVRTIRRGVQELQDFKRDLQDTAQTMIGFFKHPDFGFFSDINALTNGAELPINPAEYGSNLETQEVRSDIDHYLGRSDSNQISTEADPIKHTRRDMLPKSNKILSEAEVEQKFTQYEKALENEAKIRDAIKIKKDARIKRHKREIEQLKKEIKTLQKILGDEKRSKSLGVTEVVLIQSSIRQCQSRIDELNDKIDALIEESLELSPNEQDKELQLLMQKTHINIQKELKRYNKHY